jgi:UDP-N-acetylmuramoyl-tripeptide--D-alanyl-D-alanine ligase
MVKLSDLAQWLQVDIQGRDIEITSVVTDSKSVIPGSLFVALSGPNYDGHDFLADAQSRGAVAALVSCPMTGDMSYVFVGDTLRALGRLAAYYRAQVSCPVIGLTGTCGKTTVKAMLAHVLSGVGHTLVTHANHNNQVGVPQTLLRLRSDHDYAVVECGANRIGEIATLAHMVKPNVAIITNVGEGHLLGFGDVSQVVREKSQLLGSLVAEGVAVLNADQPYFASMAKKLSDTQTIVSFGLTASAMVSARDIISDTEARASFMLVVNGRPEGRVHLPLLGAHQVSNALAVVAATMSIGVSMGHIKKALETVPEVPGRMVRREAINEAIILDDTYNANPWSFEVALQTLASYAGDQLLVIGDMAELGNEAKQYHQRLGQRASELGIKKMMACGQWSSYTADAFLGEATIFATRKELVARMRQVLHNEMVVLVKGSNCAKMGEVVEALLAKTCA